MTPTLRLLGLLGPHARRLALAATIAITAEAAAVALMGTAGWLIARAAQRPEIAALTVAIVTVRALAVSRGFLRYADRLVGHDAVLRATASLRVRVFDAVRPLAPAGTPAFRSGDLLARLVDDVDAAQDLVLRCLVPAVVALAVGGGAVALSAAVLPQAGLALAAGLVAAGLLVPALVHRTARREPAGGGAAVRAEVATRTVDLARGADELRVLGVGEDHHRAAAQRVEDWAALQRSGARSTGSAASAQAVVAGLTVLAVALLGVLSLSSGAVGAVGVVDVVGVVVATVVAIAALEVTSPLPEAARRLAGVQTSARRLVALWDTPPPVAEPLRTPSAPLPHRPGVVIRGLVARYPGVVRPALDGLDLTLAPGERLVVHGASGSGKSTLVAVLMRFLDPEAGSVHLGGHDLRTLPGELVRRTVSGTTQDAHVFAATVRDNLRLAAPDAADPLLCATLDRVHLGPWLAALPAGLDTELTSGGTTLSGGQRIRLLLARALLADPAVLVLDEPTHGLDEETAAAVLPELLEAARGRAVLLVTHDAVNPALVDRAVTLEAGRTISTPGAVPP